MEWIKMLLNVKNFIEIAVVMVEHPGGGSEKKQKALEIIHILMKENDIHLPLPDQIIDAIIGLAIDTFVNWANENIWKKGSD